MEGRAVDQHALARRGAGDVRAVLAAGCAADGIGVRMWHGAARLVAVGVVRIADEVGAADDLGCREGAGLDGGGIVGGEVGRIARTTEVGVGVVDARVDDRDRLPAPVAPVNSHACGTPVNTLDVPLSRCIVVTGEMSMTSGFDARASMPLAGMVTVSG